MSYLPRDRSNPIGVFLADDHDLVLRGLIDILRPETDIQVVGTANSGHNLLPDIARTRPQVILCDVRMPQFEIFQFITRLQYLAQTQPHIYTTRILLLTAYADAYLAHRANELNVSGYLLKEEALSAVLAESIRKIYLGYRAYSEHVRQYITQTREAATAYNLSSDSYTVLALMVTGHTPAQIAQKLDTSHWNVYSIQRRLRHLLKASSNEQLTSRAIRDNLVPLQ